jgi:hypothetical protein
MKFHFSLPLVVFAVSGMTALTRADIVINEIMYHPASELETEEYIELRNTGAVAVNVSGWQFTSGVQYTVPAATPSIPAGGFLVVAANAAAFTAKYPTVTNFVAGWTGTLSNSANSIVLKDQLGAKIDEVKYADDGDWGVRERDDSDAGYRGWRWRSAADGSGNPSSSSMRHLTTAKARNWGASTTPGAHPAWRTASPRRTSRRL